MNSAPEELQYTLQTILADIDRVTNVADDILIDEITTEQHDKALVDVLERRAQVGLTLKLLKSIFDKPTFKYYGYSFSNEGMRPRLLQFNALKEVKRPCDAKEVKSFLGVASYLKRFIDDYSTITYPLRLLTHKNTHFKLYKKGEAAFQNLKTCLLSCTSYYDETKSNIMYCDANPVEFH